ncbi:MAG: DUF2207 domain-containing protein [Propionibacteriaceae bacterium]|nr:DUF2207 domain-containing protein [Propionibacteriaceae bacterium]
MKRTIGFLVVVVVVAGIVLGLIPQARTSGFIPLVVSLGLTAIAIGGLIRLVLLGRDEQHAHITPGEEPQPDQQLGIKYEDVTDATVRFEPPKKVPVRLAGAIVRERSDHIDVTATIVSMATRGFFTMSYGKNPGDVFFTKTAADLHGLDVFEREVYQWIFSSRVSTSGKTTPTVRLSRSEKSIERFRALVDQAEQEFLAQKWYRADPVKTVSRMRKGGITLAIVGPILVMIAAQLLFSLGVLGFLWLAVPCLVLGCGMAIIARRMPVRTVAGSTVAIQAYGFKKFLETAQGDQIRWEEGQDIFSQYLPYAVAFGCTGHWVAVFQDLIAQGVAVSISPWLDGLDAALGVLDVVGDGVDLLAGGVDLFGNGLDLLHGLDFASVFDLPLDQVAEGVAAVGEGVGAILDIFGSL